MSVFVPLHLRTIPWNPLPSPAPRLKPACDSRPIGFHHGTCNRTFLSLPLDKIRSSSSPHHSVIAFNFGTRSLSAIWVSLRNTSPF